MDHPDFDEAWQLVSQAEEKLREMGETWGLAETLHMKLWIAQLKGDNQFSASLVTQQSTEIFQV